MELVGTPLPSPASPPLAVLRTKTSLEMVRIAMEAAVVVAPSSHRSHLLFRGGSRIYTDSARRSSAGAFVIGCRDLLDVDATWKM